MKIPKPVVKRLALYLRSVQKIDYSKKKFISSHELADFLGIKASQVRKDFSYFGEFGKRGVGYDILSLEDQLSSILGMRKNWKVIIIGAGKMGRALALYSGLLKQGFEVSGIFDNDKNKIGEKIENLITKDIASITDFINTTRPDIAVITVPEQAAQAVCNLVENSGIKGIINFAPTKLKTNLPIEDVDITLSFKSLAFSINKGKLQNFDK